MTAESNPDAQGWCVTHAMLVLKHGVQQSRFFVEEMMVPRERLELSRCYQRRILNPLRLPIPPSRHSGGAV